MELSARTSSDAYLADRLRNCPHRRTLNTLSYRSEWLGSCTHMHGQSNQSSYCRQKKTARHKHGGVFVLEFIVCPWDLRSEPSVCAVKVTIYIHLRQPVIMLFTLSICLHLTFKMETSSRLELLLKGPLAGADICSVAIRSGMGKCFGKLLYIQMKILIRENWYHQFLLLFSVSD